MTTRSLTARIESGPIDAKTGEFPMVLATDGEASDGDILSIEGGELPERAPLQNAHINEAMSTLGSITSFRRDLKSSPKKLRAKGRIEMEGDGSQAEIRRDIAHMIARGHISGVSVRWEPIKYTRRSDLPKGHYARVEDDEPNPLKRYGVFFEKWRVQEGSIAPVQADPQSMIGRAEETDGDVAEFWRSAAEDIVGKRRAMLERELPDPGKFEDHFEFMRAAVPIALQTSSSDDDALEKCQERWRDVKEDAEPEKEPEPEVETISEESRAAAAAALIRQIEADTGLDSGQILAIANETLAPKPTTEQLLEQALKRIDALEGERDQSRVDGEPVPPAPSLRTTQAMFEYLEARCQQTDQKALALLNATINIKRGKVVEGQNPREQMTAEANALLSQWRAERDEDETEEIDLGPVILQLDSSMERARKQTEKALAALRSQKAAESRAQTARLELNAALSRK